MDALIARVWTLADWEHVGPLLALTHSSATRKETPT